MPEVYKGMGPGFAIASKEGALLLGWLPTLIGYSAQGFFKFGFYEIFKASETRIFLRPRMKCILFFPPAGSLLLHRR
jgi:hypothetical protein